MQIFYLLMANGFLLSLEIIHRIYQGRDLMYFIISEHHSLILCARVICFNTGFAGCQRPVTKIRRHERKKDITAPQFLIPSSDKEKV